MIDIKNKVVFLSRAASAMDKEFQLSTNVKGQLKKKIIKVKKLKIAESISIVLKGNYKEFEINIEPADYKHASKIKGMLRVKR